MAAAGIPLAGPAADLALHETGGAAVVAEPYGILDLSDISGFITAFTLAAEARGIATIAQAAPAAFSPALHDFFGLGEDRLALCVISFGYSDTAHPANGFRTARAPLDDWVDWRG